MRRVLVALFLLLVAVPVQARPAWKDPKFWLGEMVIIAAVSADVHSTNVLLRKCPSCFETNSVIRAIAGRRPNPRKLWAWASVGMGAYTAANWTIHRYAEQAGGGDRALEFAVPAGAAGIHFSAAQHNYNLLRRLGYE